jgi:hypothetical protein
MRTDVEHMPRCDFFSPRPRSCCSSQGCPPEPSPYRLPHRTPRTGASSYCARTKTGVFLRILPTVKISGTRYSPFTVKTDCHRPQHRAGSQLKARLSASTPVLRLFRLNPWSIDWNPGWRCECAGSQVSTDCQCQCDASSSGVFTTPSAFPRQIDRKDALEHCEGQ